MGAVALAVPMLLGPASAEVAPGDGIATHYDSVDGGNCSFVGPPADHLDVALDEVEYGTADACGAYVDVAGPSGTVRVKVTNRCPECPLHHLDLSKTAFARIAPLEAGQVPISYTLVRNPPVAEPITLRVKSGSSRWWLQIQADNHGNPLASFELRTGDGGWRSLVHTQDNFWMAENPGPGDGPFTVRITDVYGQSVTIDDVALAVDQVQRTDARLYGAGSAPPPPAPPPPSTTTAPPTTTTTVAPTTTTTTVAPTTTPTTARADDELTRAVVTAESHPVGPSALAVAGVTFAVVAGAALVLRRRRPAESPD